MEMERLCEELDEAKVEIEKLREDLKQKAGLLENLKRVHSEQLAQIQEANLKIEKQGQVINEKEEEVLVVKERCEELERRLNEKESAVRLVSAKNDEFRIECDMKCGKWEEEKRGLLLAMDEANEKNVDLEQKINVFRAELEGLKRLLSASEEKCLEVEKKGRVQKELRDRDDVLFKLEEHSNKVEDQLKWKKEQFKHLEEAHEKLQNQFKGSKREWEVEKSKLVDEICSLETALDSQTRISKDLESKLKMCNQALAHEERRRKCLEAEVSDYKLRFENVFSEWEDAKSQLESLSSQRDNEIASLRYSLGKKETSYKEIKYQADKLEQENQELLASMRELQEAQIQELGNSSSVAKLRNKLKRVEQMHRDCSETLRAKETDWHTRLEALTGELSSSKSELEIKETAVKELETELSNCQSAIMQLKLQNEEVSVMLLVLKSGIAEAKLNAANADSNLISYNLQRDEKISLLMKQLEMKETALAKAVADVYVERERALSLMEKIESLEHVEEERLLLNNEVKRCKEMLEDSAARQALLKEQASQMERDLQEKIKAACDSLDIANSELADERARVESLSRKAASADHIEEKRLMLQKELDQYKEILDESLTRERDLKEKLREASDALREAKSEMGKELERVEALSRLKEQASQMERDLQEKIKAACDSLDIANSKLAEEHARVESLSRKAESADHIQEKRLMLQKELDQYKEALNESFTRERDLKEKLRETSDALHGAKSEMGKEQEKVENLSNMVERYEKKLEEQQLLLEEEVEKREKMFEESRKAQVSLEEKALYVENDLKETLAEVSEALDSANCELAEESEKTASLSRRIKDLISVQEQQLLMQKDIEKFKEMLEESSKHHSELENQALQKANGYKKKLQELRDALDKANSEVAVKTCEGHAVEFELWVWKSHARQLNDALQENHVLRKELESSLLAQVNVGESLKERIKLLEQKLETSTSEATASSRMEKFMSNELETLSRTMREKDELLADLQKEIELLEHESLKSEFESALFAKISAERIDQELGKKQAETCLIQDTLEKIAASRTLLQAEIEQKNLMIAELEEEINSMQQKQERQEQSLSHSRQQAVEIETQLQTKLTELTTKLETSENLVNKLESDNRVLSRDVTDLTSEKESLTAYVEGLADRIRQISLEDMKLMRKLETIVQSPNDMQLSSKVKENLNHCHHHSPNTTKTFHAEERSPFRELNMLH